MKKLLALLFFALSSTAHAQVVAKDLIGIGMPPAQANKVLEATRQLTSGGLKRFELDSSGNLNQDPTNGGNVILSKASTALALTVANSVSAAGSDLATATQLTSQFANITTVSSSTGVKLFDVSGKNGIIFAIKNSGANALAIYPPTASGVINGGSTGASVSCATAELCILIKVATNAYIGGAVVNF